MHVGNVVVNKDGQARVFFEQLLLDKGAILDWDIKTGPSDPCELHHALETGESRDESSGRHLVLVGSRGILGDGNWKTVRNNEQTQVVLCLFALSGLCCLEQGHILCVCVFVLGV